MIQEVGKKERRGISKWPHGISIYIHISEECSESQISESIRAAVEMNFDESPKHTGKSRKWKIV
jgi:hypothetical protein